MFIDFFLSCSYNVDGIRSKEDCETSNMGVFQCNFHATLCIVEFSGLNVMCSYYSGIFPFIFIFVQLFSPILFIRHPSSRHTPSSYLPSTSSPSLNSPFVSYPTFHLFPRFYSSSTSSLNYTHSTTKIPPNEKKRTVGKREKKCFPFVCIGFPS